jgi:hypothetical protein
MPTPKMPPNWTRGPNASHELNYSGAYYYCYLENEKWFLLQRFKSKWYLLEGEADISIFNFDGGEVHIPEKWEKFVSWYDNLKTAFAVARML